MSNRGTKTTVVFAAATVFFVAAAGLGVAYALTPKQKDDGTPNNARAVLGWSAVGSAAIGAAAVGTGTVMSAKNNPRIIKVK